MAKKEKKIINKKDSKRVKITMTDILKLGFKKLEPVDMSKFHEEDKKKVAKDKLRYEKELKAETIRYENLACPVCRDTKKERNVISHMNGQVVYGGRNSSTVHADYLICQGCGLMFVDINKKEITSAYRGTKPLFGQY